MANESYYIFGSGDPDEDLKNMLRNENNDKKEDCSKEKNQT